MTANSIPVTASGLTFDDLYRREGLVKLDLEFLAELEKSDAPLGGQLVRARAEPAALTQKQESELLLALAPHLERFVARVFGIEAEARALAARHHDLAPLYSVKRQFVQRKAANRWPLRPGTASATIA